MVLLSLKDTVKKYGLMAKKSLGQNFLLDMNITQKIIRESLNKQNKNNFSDTNVVEIGPGPGGLTRAILENKPCSLTVIEMDERCIEIMRELSEETDININIIEGDALKQNFIGMTETPRQIVSNLPYNISVPLLTMWLKNAGYYEALTLMFQKEVADRILAEPGSKSYGRISIFAQLTCKVIRLFDINPNSFVPAPKIWSTVLLFQPIKNQPKEEELDMLERLTALAFGQRRKMLRQSLKSIKNISEILLSCEISSDLRAENLSPQQYLSLAKTIISQGISVQ